MENVGQIIKDMLTPELFPLVIVLYVVGMYFEKAKFLDSRHIPLLLAAISLIANVLYILSTTSISGTQEVTGAILTILIQTILFAAAPVYINQIYVQEVLKKKEDSTTSS